MVVLLLLLGFIALAAGIFGLGVGVPAKETAFGAAMLVSASVALTGGLIMLGLAAAVSELRRVLQAGMRFMRTPERFEGGSQGARRMEPRLGAASGGTYGAASDDETADVIPTRFDAPEPAERRRMPPRDEWPASDAGHARAAPPPFPPAPGAAAEPRRTPPRPASSGPAPSGPAPSGPAPSAASPERFETIRPSDYRKPDAEEPEQRSGASPPPGPHAGDLESPPPPSPPAEPPASGAVRPVRVVKSGVINDVAYTFFSDGSIETHTSEGTQHFASLDEFRHYMEKSA